MTTKTPSSRRSFANEWDEIDYLYEKMLYWLYDRGNPRQARPFADRLECLLNKAAAGPETIFGEECRSLISELKGDLPAAIKHRENEIRLMKELHQLAAGTPGKDLVLGRYDYGDLSDRLDLLAVLYHNSGELDRAISTLQESKQLCEAHGIPFYGRDILEAYLAETKAGPGPATASA
jgi:hypothetical protein